MTYKPPTTEKLGSLSARYQLSSEDMNKYKSSLSELCHRMKAVSAGSRVSLEEAATQPLKREVLAQARRYCSVGEVDGGGGGGGRLAGDLAECRASLTDIRDRIGSLQSLLRASRTVRPRTSKFQYSPFLSLISACQHFYETSAASPYP